MPHLYTHKDPTIATVLLLRRIGQIHEPYALPRQLLDFARRRLGVLSVRRVKAVVVEGDTVDKAHEQERPMGTAFGYLDGATVVNGEEDVCCAGKIREGVFKGKGIKGFEEHE